MIEASRIHEAINKGIDYLENQQKSHGEFRTLLGPGAQSGGTDFAKMNQANLVEDSSPFVTTFAADILGKINQKRCRAMIGKCISFLEQQMEAGGMWRYYSSLQFKHFRIPPDADDIACASYCLRKYGIDFPDNRWILEHNKNGKGIFYTWVYPRRISFNGMKLAILRLFGPLLKQTSIPDMPEEARSNLRFAQPRDPVPKSATDPAVNANVLLYLGENDSTRAAINFIIDIIKSGREKETSLYYTDPAALYYFVARAYRNDITSLSEVGVVINERIEKRQSEDGSIDGSVLLTALCVSALISFNGARTAIDRGMCFLFDQQDVDGSWPIHGFYAGPDECWGSQELTTTFCIEALNEWLARYCSMQDIVPAINTVFIDETYSLYESGIGRDPYSYYAALREQRPVHHVAGQNLWVISRYDDVARALKDTENYSNSPNKEIEPLLIGADPPEHTLVRRWLMPAFLKGSIERLDSQMRILANELTDPFVLKGQGDLVENFTSIFPVRIIQYMMGIDDIGPDRLKRWSDSVLSPGENLKDSSLRYKQRLIFNEFTSYLHEYVYKFRQGKISSPTLDMIYEDDSSDVNFTDSQLIYMVRFLVIAGFETTRNLLGNMFYTLATRPDLQAVLLGDPGSQDAFIEESLRIDSPTQVVKRKTLNDVVVRGHTIPAGAVVALHIGAANHDPDHYDNPEQFRLDRKKRGHLAFGAGAHSCLGIHLARLEAQIALQEVLPRLRGLRLKDPDAGYVPVDILDFRSPKHLDVVFDLGE